MSDDFIPLNQSTPIRGRWQSESHNQQPRNFQNNRYQTGQNRGGGHRNRWRNNSQRNSSYGSENNGSYGYDSRSNIDAYLHPSMLQDPWAHLRQKAN